MRQKNVLKRNLIALDLLFSGLIALTLQALPTQSEPTPMVTDGVHFFIVVHADNPTNAVPRAELSKIFLKKWQGWIPVDQNVRSEVRKAFSKVVHRKHVGVIQHYWQRQIFSGRGVPPLFFDTDEEVLDYVRNHLNAVGYVFSLDAHRRWREGASDLLRERPSERETAIRYNQTMTRRMRLKRFAIRWLAISLVGACVMPASGPASGEPAARDPGFQVVIHSDNPTPPLPSKTLSRIFLKRIGQRYRWSGGTRVVPVDLDAKQPARDAFSKAIHGRSASSIKSYWNRQIFSGNSAPPPEVKTVEEVFQHIRENPGGVGYVPTGTALPDWVRGLEITE